MLWVGTDNGLAILNTRTSPFTPMSLDGEYKSAVSDMCIWKIYNDQNGSIWLCTNGNGLINYNIATHETTIYKTDGNSAYKIAAIPSKMYS